MCHSNSAAFLGQQQQHVREGPVLTSPRGGSYWLSGAGEGSSSEPLVSFFGGGVNKYILEAHNGDGCATL